MDRGGRDRENNHWIRTMCDGNRLHLTEPKRCQADDPLWDFYSSIRRPTPGLDEGGSRYHWDLKDMINLAQENFPLTRRATWNLTLIHQTRITINDIHNRIHALECKEMGIEPIFVEKSDRPSPNEPQDVWFFPCLHLIAYIGQGKMGQLHNGQLFRVLSLSLIHI